MTNSRRRLLLALALSAAMPACCLAALAIAAGGSNQREAAQLLRLTDLPLGYVTAEQVEDRGDAALCERLTEPDDTPARMLKFIERFHPRGCVFAFDNTYAETDAEGSPLLIGTGILDAHSAAEADAGWAVIPEMLGRLLDTRPPKPTTAPAKVGSATRLFHLRTLIIGIGAKAPVSFLVWRSGNTLAAVMAAGRRGAVDDATALLLAKREQARIAKPTPLRQAENYDGEVALENPALDLPVYWLGRHFETGGGVADATLEGSWFSEEAWPERETEDFLVGPTAQLRLDYSNPAALDLATWSRADWPIYRHSKAAKALVTWKCTRTRAVEVPGGTATIYLGYEKDYAKCPPGKPRSVTAWVKFGEDTVVVNEPVPVGAVERDGPWSSFGAMEAVVKGLRLRTPSAD